MTTEELDLILEKYNDRELIFKQYYSNTGRPSSMDEFIKDDTFDKSNVLMKEFVELAGDSRQISINEESIFNNLDFNVNVFKHDRYTPIFTHRHHFFEILYVYSGRCTETIELETIELNTGDVCIISPEVEHAVAVFDDSIVINILIRQTTFDRIFSELLEDNNILSNFFKRILYTKNYNNYIVFRTNNSETIRMTMVHLFIESIEKREFSNKMLDYIISILFANLLRRDNRSVEIPVQLKKNNDQISSLLFYIQDHYQNVTLQELSQQFNYSISYLSRLIKLHTGYNFKDLTQKIKLEKAAHLLKNTDLKIYEICNQLGYENTTHFNRMFKKKYGVAPNQFRNKNSPELI